MKNFNNLQAIKTVYVSNVRIIPETANVVWSPLYEIYMNKIDRVQRKFLRWAALGLTFLSLN